MDHFMRLLHLHTRILLLDRQAVFDHVTLYFDPCGALQVV